MNPKTSSARKFLSIKKLCEVISKNMANEYVKAKKEKPIVTDPDYPIDVSKFRKEIGDLCERFSIKAHYETTQSGARDTNGEWIPFLAFTQMFEIETPILTNFVGQLGGLFEIIPGQKEVTIKGTSGSAPLKCLSSYFIGGEEIYAVNMASGEILKITGHQEGGFTLGDNGEILVGLNIEYEILLETIIHEIVHAKWPKEIPQEKIHHEMIDKMANEIIKRLDLPLRIPISEIPPLKRERLQIRRQFENFDKELGRIIFP